MDGGFEPIFFSFVLLKLGRQHPIHSRGTKPILRCWIGLGCVAPMHAYAWGSTNSFATEMNSWASWNIGSILGCLKVTSAFPNTRNQNFSVGLVGQYRDSFNKHRQQE